MSRRAGHNYCLAHYGKRLLGLILATTLPMRPSGATVTAILVKVSTTHPPCCKAVQAELRLPPQSSPGGPHIP